MIAAVAAFPFLLTLRHHPRTQARRRCQHSVIGHQMFAGLRHQRTQTLQVVRDRCLNFLSPLLTALSSRPTTVTGTKAVERSRSRHRHQYIVAGASPWLAAKSRTPSPLFSWAAIRLRHLSSFVFVMPRILAATRFAPRWVYRALTATEHGRVLAPPPNRLPVPSAPRDLYPR